MAAKAKLRCAIYTRKSSEEGLEQDYNSLHAQRDACEAYVKSQIGEGWSPLPTAYDDGGISGGTMERDGLRRLLKDIEDGKIDVVVVYKVDRLTRALGDFARIVEIFDKHGVSFVSVTQAFNTTTSMGRLTLNVLLSFAQFEREVTGERIRDKIAASKAKGLWMGGKASAGAIQRIPAEPTESWMRDLLARLLPASKAIAIRAVGRIEVHAQSVQVQLDAKVLAPTVRERRLLLDATSANLQEGERLSEEEGLWWLHIPHRLQFRGGRVWTAGSTLGRSRQDRVLINALKSGHRILQEAAGPSGWPDQAPANGHDRTLIRLAFLAPDIQQQIVEGRQSASLCLEDLRRSPIPLCWDDQRRLTEA